jgi:hypothetical protein
VTEERRRWEPMSREQFRELHRGRRLRDRPGRAWTVHNDPFEEDGLASIVIRSGDLIRRVPERFADDYELVGEEGGSEPPDRH